MAKHVVEAGCDGATLCAFDPAALPGDFDAVSAEDPVGLMERLQRQQRFWIGDTGGDGSYVFHIHVDEPTPPNDLPCRRVAKFDAFAVPGGKLWICGAEYAARDPVAGSDLTPPGGLGRFGMGGYVPLPSGIHRLTISEVAKRDTVAAAAVGKASARSMIAVTFCGLGGFLGALAALVLVISSATKIWQLLLANPMFTKGWQVFPVAAVIAVFGGALFATGWQLLRYEARSPEARARAVAAATTRAKIPDYLIEITTEKSA